MRTRGRPTIMWKWVMGKSKRGGLNLKKEDTDHVECWKLL